MNRDIKQREVANHNRCYEIKRGVESKIVRTRIS